MDVAFPPAVMRPGPWSCLQPHCFSLAGLTFLLISWHERPSFQPWDNPCLTGTSQPFLCSLQPFTSALHPKEISTARVWQQSRVNGLQQDPVPQPDHNSFSLGCCCDMKHPAQTNVFHAWFLAAGSVVEGSRNCRRGGLAAGSKNWGWGGKRVYS